MAHILRTLPTAAVAAATTALALALCPLPADAQSRHGGWQSRGGHSNGHGHWGPGSGWVWGGVGLGIGLGIGSYYSPYYGPGYGPYYGYPGYTLVQPPVVVYNELPAAPRAPAVAARPDPVVYPRNGQSAEQIEADRQACNRWATTQHNAMQDGSVFQRATDACMDARGYTLR